MESDFSASSGDDYSSPIPANIIKDGERTLEAEPFDSPPISEIETEESQRKDAPEEEERADFPRFSDVRSLLIKRATPFANPNNGCPVFIGINPAITYSMHALLKSEEASVSDLSNVMDGVTVLYADGVYRQMRASLIPAILKELAEKNRSIMSIKDDRIRLNTTAYLKEGFLFYYNELQDMPLQNALIAAAKSLCPVEPRAVVNALIGKTVRLPTGMRFTLNESHVSACDFLLHISPIVHFEESKITSVEEFPKHKEFRPCEDPAEVLFQILQIFDVYGRGIHYSKLPSLYKVFGLHAESKQVFAIANDNSQFYIYNDYIGIRYPIQFKALQLNSVDMEPNFDISTVVLNNLLSFQSPQPIEAIIAKCIGYPCMGRNLNESDSESIIQVLATHPAVRSDASGFYCIPPDIEALLYAPLYSKTVSDYLPIPTSYLTTKALALRLGFLRYPNSFESVAPISLISDLYVLFSQYIIPPWQPSCPPQKVSLQVHLPIKYEESSSHNDFDGRSPDRAKFRHTYLQVRGTKEEPKLIFLENLPPFEELLAKSFVDTLGTQTDVSHFFRFSAILRYLNGVELELFDGSSHTISNDDLSCALISHQLLHSSNFMMASDMTFHFLGDVYINKDVPIYEDFRSMIKDVLEKMHAEHPTKTPIFDTDLVAKRMVGLRYYRSSKICITFYLDTKYRCAIQGTVRMPDFVTEDTKIGLRKYCSDYVESPKRDGRLAFKRSIQEVRKEFLSEIKCKPIGKVESEKLEIRQKLLEKMRQNGGRIIVDFENPEVDHAFIKKLLEGGYAKGMFKRERSKICKKTETYENDSFGEENSEDYNDDSEKTVSNSLSNSTDREEYNITEPKKLEKRKKIIFEKPNVEKKAKRGRKPNKEKIKEDNYGETGAKEDKTGYFEEKKFKVESKAAEKVADNENEMDIKCVQEFELPITKPPKIVLEKLTDEKEIKKIKLGKVSPIKIELPTYSLDDPIYDAIVEDSKRNRKLSLGRALDSTYRMFGTGQTIREYEMSGFRTLGRYNPGRFAFN